MINYERGSMCLNFKRNFENKLHPNKEQSNILGRPLRLMSKVLINSIDGQIDFMRAFITNLLLPMQALLEL